MLYKKFMEKDFFEPLSDTESWQIEIYVSTKISVIICT